MTAFEHLNNPKKSLLLYIPQTLLKNLQQILSELAPKHQRLSPVIMTMNRYLTTTRGEGGIDPRIADDLILKTMPDISSVEIEALLRHKYGNDNLETRKILAPYAGRFSSTSTYRIRAVAALSSGNTVRREARVLVSKERNNSLIVSLEDAVP